MTVEATALDRAINLSGGTGYALAKRLGLPRQTVYGWLKAGRVLSAESVLAVERVTGVSRSELRPDLYPKEMS